tara:strand:- start:1583 stop:1777 length:195 start_codon:yes stop_codon:yes gene_type:complete
VLCQQFQRGIRHERSALADTSYVSFQLTIFGEHLGARDLGGHAQYHLIIQLARLVHGTCALLSP